MYKKLLSGLGIVCLATVSGCIVDEPEVPLDSSLFNIYPPYDTNVENPEITISAANAVQNIQKVTINGETISAADLNNWSSTQPLEIGENTFTIVIETANGKATTTRKVRYHGIFMQGSGDLAFYDGKVYLDDYRRDNVMELDAQNSFQRAINADSIDGFPADSLITKHALADNVLYAVTRKQTSNADAPGEIEISYQLYSINTQDNTISLIIEDTGSALFGDDFSFDNFRINATRDALYVTNRDMQLLKIDPSDASVSLITSLPNGPDTSVNFQNMVIDDANDRLIGVTTVYTYTPSFSSEEYMAEVPFTGDNAGVPQAIALSDAAGCEAIDSNVPHMYLSPTIRNNVVYAAIGANQVYSLDLSTNCWKNILTVGDNDYHTNSSLQGVDYDPATDDLYLGFYSNTAKYNLTSSTYTDLEPAGFADEPGYFTSTEFFAYSASTDTIIANDDEVLVAYNAKTQQVTEVVTLSDEITGIAKSADDSRAYVGTEEGEIGYVSFEDLTYTQLLAPTDNFEVELLVDGGEGLLYYIDSDVIYTFNLDDHSITELSGKENNGIELRREDTLLLDTANNRLIVDTEDGAEDYLVAVDLATGDRTQLSASNEVFDRMGKSILSADGQTIIFESQDTLHQYTLADGTISTFVEERDGLSQLGDLTDMTLMDDNTLMMSDDDSNGFWMINLITGERSLLK